MRVGIIGAGAAGLASAKHVLANGLDCVVYEMGSEMGGLWVYTDDVGEDMYGYPVYSAMYKGLRTNLPKEVMGFPDFPIPEQEKSYLTQPEVLHFLNLYADNFNLKPNIKLNSFVTNVRPLEDNTWELSYVFKPTKEKITETFDAIMICSGHYNEPIVPDIPQIEKFKGNIEHSHTFRALDPYNDKRVLVIGGGPSGLDLTLQVSKVAKQVTLSHHSARAKDTIFPDNVDTLPDVKSILNDNQIEFVDGVCRHFDMILYCTGYKYTFPFLHESCGIKIDNNYIQPLYKHLVHIEKPTMCFIGMPFQVCAFHMFDLQARYFCQYLTGAMVLPSKEEMMLHTEQEMQSRWGKGFTKKHAHLMGQLQKSYYGNLAAEANTTTIAPVIINLRNLSAKKVFYDLLNFREDRYKIIDDENYMKV